MSYRLRPYQKKAVEATLAYFRKSKDPACIVLPTGAGKSLVIAELCRIAKGRVLVLAHVKELCEQNYQKMRAMDKEADLGLFSAGLGEKRSEAHITFAGVQSVARHLEEFKQPVSLVIIDECHRVSLDEDSQYQAILRHLRSLNPELRVLGLTATPYRLGLGFCYQRHAWGLVRSEAEKPFCYCAYEVTLKYMVEQDYLTPPQLVDAPIAQYDFSSLEAGSARQGLFEEREVNSLLVRSKRVTESIVAQIVELTEQQERRGVMIFAATVEHAEEVVSYLPDGTAGLILGSTETNQRDQTIRRFCEQKIKYLVNVAVLTTGFDAPHVDFIAILRKTESVSLFQQIVGRGLRLYPGKKDCLVIDYAGNGYQLYTPEIGEKKPNASSEMVKVECPECGYQNDFWGQLDGDGRVVEHYGRRCTGLVPTSQQRCPYRFRFKECPHCGGENDIAARNCGQCEKVLIDPDELLKDALRLKDALVLRVSGVEFLREANQLTLVYHDEDGGEVKERFNFDNQAQRAIFNRTYARRIASGRRPLELETAEQAQQLQTLFPRPDFVVARAKKTRGRPPWFRVQERVFDYHGRFRTAPSAS